MFQNFTKLLTLAFYSAMYQLNVLWFSTPQETKLPLGGWNMISSKQTIPPAPFEKGGFKQLKIKQIQISLFPLFQRGLGGFGDGKQSKFSFSNKLHYSTCSVAGKDITYGNH